MKKFFLMMSIFALASFAFARNKGLSLDIGAHYENHSLHYFDDGKMNDFNVHSNHNKHMGGFNLGLDFMVAENWSIFLDTSFSFNGVFVNDSAIGFGYNFNIGKGFNLFIGGGFGFGGSQFKWSVGNVETKQEFFNVGVNLKLIASYMFTNKVGIFFGITDTYYIPAMGKQKIKFGSNEKEFSIKRNNLPNYVQSIQPKLGIRLAF